MMRYLPLLAITLAACTSAAPTPLSAFGSSTVEIDAEQRTATHLDDAVGDSTPTVTVTISAASCPTAGDDLTATFDGVAMTLTAAGGVPSSDTTSCDQVVFSLSPAPTETPGTTSTVAITDSTANWTIQGRDAMARDLVLTTPMIAGTNAIVEWTGVDSIDTGDVQLTIGDTRHVWGADGNLDADLLVMDGNAMTADLVPSMTGAGWLSVEASRERDASRCDGPTQCSIFVRTGGDFAVSVDAP